MRVLIAAAGPQTKWGGHRGVPSHLVTVDGRPLLHRTVEQALRFSGDVHVTGPPGDTRYAIDGTHHHARDTAHASEYHSTRDLWSDQTRTVLLYGDVYFTDAAIATIMGSTDPGFRAFGRSGPSDYTGCRYGEFFAASWWPADHDVIDRHLTAALRQQSRRPVCWLLLNSIQGRRPANRHHDAKVWTEVDDLTEDFDFPDDYERHPAADRLSATIMAHRKRREWAEALSAKVGCPIVWDRHNDVWDTARRAWLAYDPNATHHLVLQDDILVCDRLLEAARHVAAAAGNVPVSLAVVDYRMGHQQAAYTKAVKSGRRWFHTDRGLTGLATLLPTGDIPAMVAYGDEETTPHDDLKIAKFYRSRRQSIWFTIPSLVQHRPADTNPSLVAGNGRAGETRTSSQFVGEDVAGDSFDWATSPGRPFVPSWRDSGMATFVNIRSTHLDPITVEDGSASYHRLSRLTNVWRRLDEPPASQPSPPDLSRKLKAELIEMADTRGLDTSGTKADLIARLT